MLCPAQRLHDCQGCRLSTCPTICLLPKCCQTSHTHFQEPPHSCLCSIDKNFLLPLWDCLLLQAILSLNLMHSCRLVPDFLPGPKYMVPSPSITSPLHQPGIRVIMHETPTACSSWSPRAVNGWYIGQASDSYHCYHVWIWETQAERISDMLEWFPTKVTMSLASSVETPSSPVPRTFQALQHPSPGTPLARLTGSEAATLRSLFDILLNQQVEAASPLPSPDSPDMHISPPISPSPMHKRMSEGG
jgi:hypothetical protein